MVWLSKFVNRILTGCKNKTVCASIYEWRVESNSLMSILSLRLIDKLFWFDKQHCRKAYCSWKWGVK